MAFRKPILVILLVAALAGCDSAKDRARKHLASAISLLQAGDTERAIVELRNVFKLDDRNRQAHATYAGILEKRDDFVDAYAQYVHIVEQYPDDVDALKNAARLAARANKWQDAGLRVDAGLKLAPKDPELLAVKAAVDYADALFKRDDQARADVVVRAAALAVADPGNILLQRIAIDNDLRQKDYKAAATAIDAALVTTPDDKELYELRLQVLSELGDIAGIDALLRRMITVFPDDPAMPATLVRWYVSRNDLDKAEAYLRESVKADPNSVTAQLQLVSFLTKYRTPDVALAEIDRIISEGLPTQPDTDSKAPGDKGTKLTLATFRAIKDSILFDSGKQEEAIADLRQVIAGAAPSDETRSIKVALARMLNLSGDKAGGDKLIDQVLEEDKGQVDALKLRAAWDISDDKADDAIALLRSAMDARSTDPGITTLMAQAYERLGKRDLMGDMLSQAVELSNRAPEESIRYAAYLSELNKNVPAESVLVNALRLDNANLDILVPLGQLYLKMKDWPRATSVANRFAEIGTPEALADEAALRPLILQGQKKTDDAVDYLQGLVRGGTGGLDAEVAIIRAYLANGEPENAMRYITDLLAKSPQDPDLRFVAATVKSATGDTGGAEADYRALLKEDPQRPRVWVALVRQLMATGEGAAARSALEQALALFPDQTNLLMIKAAFAEADGKIDDAIAIDEKLYAADTGNAVAANNLASLLASYRSDPADLERAYAVARRLSGTKVPAFQDTFGWITYLRGDPAAALPYLEGAAAGLKQDPLVQFHLAEAYRSLGRSDDARRQYAKVVALVPAKDGRAFVVNARERLAAPSGSDGAPKK